MSIANYRLGASDFASCCGIGHTSRIKLWLYKTKRKEKEVTPWMQHGKDNEHFAVSNVEMITGLWFDHTGANQAKKTLVTSQGWTAVCMPDGICDDIILEVKCPAELRDEVRDYYQVQCQAMCTIGNYEKVLYAEWRPKETRMWWVHPSEKLERQIFRAANDFMGYWVEDERPKRFSRKPELTPLKTERFRGVVGTIEKRWEDAAS